MQKHRQQLAWHRCRELAVAVYRTTETFPASERFGLTSQMRRAAVSSAANIAEGQARRGQTEFAHFLDIALGSLAELDTLFEIARETGVLSAEGYASLQAGRSLASRASFALLRRVRPIARTPVGPLAR